MSDESSVTKFPQLHIHKVEKHGFFVYQNGSRSDTFSNIFIANMQLLHAYNEDKVDNDGLRRGLYMIAQSSLPGPTSKN